MSKPKGEKSTRPLRRPMNHETDVQYADQYRSESLFPDKGEADQTGKTRIMVPVTKESLEFLKQEADQTATSVSALCALAIYDWIAARKRARQETPEMMRKLDEYNRRHTDWPETVSRVNREQK